jgi:hypothetical protein
MSELDQIVNLCGEPFHLYELFNAQEYLAGKKLVKFPKYDPCKQTHTSLTANGIDCVENWESKLDEYLAHQTELKASTKLVVLGNKNKI